jgi:hypothetical protein
MATTLVSLLIVTLLAADGPVSLREKAKVGDASKVAIELKAEGQFKQTAPEGEPSPKPLAFKVESRLEFHEKVLAVATDGSLTRVVRRVEKAGSAINGEIRPSSAVLRPELSLLVAELKAGQAVVVSPGGPLMRSELELVQGPGDPLALGSLLPAGQLTKGDTWTVGSDAARSLSGYDVLDDNALKATLETSTDDPVVTAKLNGTIRGSALGGLGTITLNGSFKFDTKANLVTFLQIDRKEIRQAGPVEAGLDVKSTLTVTRQVSDVPPDLNETTLKDVPLEIKPDRELLMFKSPDGKYAILHDRDWHTFWDSDRLSVLKRLSKGEVIANCNLSRGPNAGKGRHQDPAQLREDIRKAAGKRFVRVIGEGKLDGPPEAGYRYKVSVEGREGEVGVLWYYYLMAGPEGDQVLAVFTTAFARQELFGDQDLRLIGTFEWLPPEQAAKP